MTVDEIEELADDLAEARRAKSRPKLDQIATELETAMREAGLDFSCVFQHSFVGQRDHHVGDAGRPTPCSI